MREYEVFRPKLDKPRHLAGRKEAKIAYDHFIASIPERIEILKSFVQECGYPLSEGRDFLPILNNFYYGACTEIVGQESLSPLELSLANDINMYIGNSLVEKFENLYWQFNTFKDVNHQSPVIVGFSNVKNKKYNREFFRPIAGYGIRIIKGKPKEGDLFFKFYDSCVKFA